MHDAWALTKARFERRNAPAREFCSTPFGERVTSKHLLEPLAEFIAGKRADGERPFPPPKGLGKLISRLDAYELAVIAVTPLLDCINRGWDGRDTRSAEMLLKKKIGEFLHDKLAMKGLLKSEDKAVRAVGKRLARGGRRGKATRKYLKLEWDKLAWGVEERVRAGHWLMQCALSLDYFTTDEYGFPAIAPYWQAAFDETREQMLRADPVLLPHTSPPPDWTGWRNEYDSRLGATFVRDWRSETKAAITEAFKSEFEHARGVNNLQQVAIVLDPVMVELVDRFAVELMDHDDNSADRRLVADDIGMARALDGQPFWLTYNCDRRGRVYPIPHLNYAREDHVRAMFAFAHGLPLRADDIRWLEIHCANCCGRNKDTFDQRIRWTKDNQDTIKAIAADPFNTFNDWRYADEPLRYVAACRELAGAWQDPEGFVTHLPVCFDGSCNGVQHLALLSRDEGAGRRVNLIDSDEPQDVYGDLAAVVKELVEIDDDEDAEAWRKFFSTIDKRQVRKLIKRPAMTYAYSVTNSGMRDHIKESCAKNNSLNPFYLATKIREAADSLLQGPAAVMEFIRRLTGKLADRGEVLQWTSPTGFPVSNDYRKPDTRTIVIRDGIRVRHKIAVGCLSQISTVKARNAASPNFVHSLDAAHLIRVVNRANAEGIANMLTVHDSYACLAPQAVRLGEIIRSELAELYATDHLYWLYQRYLHVPGVWPPPELGGLEPDQVITAKYSFGS